MGIFSRKGEPSKPGSYKTDWPQESGLGVGPYSQEAEAQDAYLLYTSERRDSEPVPQVDKPMMQEAERLILTLAGGDPPNERPLIQGPIDVQWFAPAFTTEFAAQALITDRRFIVWWPSMRSMEGSLIILDHVGMIPRDDTGARIPFKWIGGFRTQFPLRASPLVSQLGPVAAKIGVHFSSSGHDNRRTMSVHKTLLHLEQRARVEQLDPTFRL